MMDDSADTGQLSSRKVLQLLCQSLADMRETKGVSPAQIYKFIQHKFGEKQMDKLTEGRIRLELQRGVQDGVLVKKRNGYNLNSFLNLKLDKGAIAPKPRDSSESLRSQDSSLDGCGCPRKKRRKATKRCGQTRRLVCRRVCKRVGPGLLERLLTLLSIKKDGRKKNFIWVKSHCRRTALKRRKSSRSGRCKRKRRPKRRKC